MKKMKRKKIYRKHAVQRVIERTDVSIKTLEEKIKHKQFRFIERQSHTRSLCVTKIKGENIWFVLRKPNVLITIIPNENRKIQKYIRDGVVYEPKKSV